MMCMSLIPCTSQCVYQQDGVCTLDSAAAAGQPSARHAERWARGPVGASTAPSSVDVMPRS